MTFELSANTKAILLLTAPLIVGQAKGKRAVKPLAPSEYRGLARRLRDLGRQPSDLLAQGLDEIVDGCGATVDAERLEQLLGRGFLLAQAVERWRTRAIWVTSRADADYPQRLKKRLGENAPPVLYGCGELAILNAGGLAVVGSRDVPSTLLEYTEDIGRLAGVAGRGLISGGARGVDKAGMDGALLAGGQVAGILANGLETAAMRREHREMLMDGQLVLASPYDPAAHFSAGHAMQRNKLIYALADAALVVNSDFNRGGTWTGAAEQLDKLRLVPIYVRSTGESARGLEELRTRGALAWPNPSTPAALEQLLDPAPSDGPYTLEPVLPIVAAREPQVSVNEGEADADVASSLLGTQTSASVPCLADKLFATVEELIDLMDGPLTDASVADALQVSKPQANAWLKRFVEGQIKGLFESADEGKTEADVAQMLRVPTRYARSCLKGSVSRGELVKEKGSRPIRYRLRDDLISPAK